MKKHTEEFKQEAVRIALTSRLSRECVARDLGIGKSTLGKWLAQYRPADLVVTPQADLACENKRPCLENRVLKEGEAAQSIRGIDEHRTDILKKAKSDLGSSSRASGREVRFRGDFGRGELAAPMAGQDDLPGDAGQHPWLSLVAITGYDRYASRPGGFGGAGP